MRRPLLLAVLAGTFLATPALADVTVRYRAVIPDAAPANVRANPPSITVAADDAGQARWDLVAPGNPAGGTSPSVALITREGATYIAASGPQPGLQLVTRMDDLLALGIQMAGPILQGPARATVQQVMQQRVEIVPVGPETVAGIRGNLYRVVLVNGDVRSAPVEIVVATDPRLAPIGREFARLFESLRPTVVALAGGEPQILMAMRGLAGLGAPLRIGTDMRIDTISMDDLPDSRFALPGPVLSREQLQQVLGMVMGFVNQAGQGAGARPPATPATPPAPATPGNATDSE